MTSVNQKLSRWKDSVREYLFDMSGRTRNDGKAWGQARLRREIEACVEAPRGEMDARKRAAEIGAAYAVAEAPERKRILALLVDEFGPVVEKVDAAIGIYRQAREQDLGVDSAAASLREALRPRRVELLTRFTSLPDGMKFLVDMREELLAFIREDEGLRPLDADMRGLFRLWFDQGFLDIERITWSSSASLLEKLMDYEAIHSIVSWEDLKNRLDRDRRCYTVFHPRMPGEPLAILHVALTTGIATNVQSLLDVQAPPLAAAEADTAVFYSVTSPQRGLRGISFGEYIIKEAVKQLRSELPDLKTFVTLSPVPGFRLWLEKNLEDGELDNLPFAADALFSVLERVAGGEEPDWLPTLEAFMHRKCLEYLTTLQRGRPVNPVTRFHLRNGASIHRINFMGDRSANGLRSACGMMVNYGYNLKTLETNLAKYHEGQLPVSGKLLRTARGEKLPVGHLVTG